MGGKGLRERVVRRRIAAAYHAPHANRHSRHRRAGDLGGGQEILSGAWVRCQPARARDAGAGGCAMPLCGTTVLESACARGLGLRDEDELVTAEGDGEITPSMPFAHPAKRDESLRCTLAHAGGRL
jgi:hypothetical protein